MYFIARRYRVSMQMMINDNQLEFPDRLVPGQSLVIVVDSIKYKVQRGETLYDIAKKFGVTVEAILKANPKIRGKSAICPNQMIIIPSSPLSRRSIDINGYCYINIDADTLDYTLSYLTYISPFSYEVRPDGGLENINVEAIISAAVAKKVAPLMVITNINEAGEFDSDLAGEILQNSCIQEILLDNIIDVMQEKGFYGLDVDFEYVRGEDRENYNAFLKRAARRLHPLGYKLSTAVAAKSSVNTPGALYEGQDYEAHGRIVDMILIMTYDWGYKYGPPMAVSPLNKMEETIQFAVTKIPSKKILLGIPNYGYDWKLPYESGRAAQLITNVAAVSLAVSNWSEIKFDEISQTPYFNYRDNNGDEHVVWFDDARSIKAKLGLIDKYRLRGFGYWNINNLFKTNWIVASSMYKIR